MLKPNQNWVPEQESDSKNTPGTGWELRNGKSCAELELDLIKKMSGSTLNKQFVLKTP